MVSITGVQPLNTITYEYLDTNWKDKLTSYNGQPITYDAMVIQPITMVMQ
jgi:hypothetical protein